MDRVAWRAPAPNEPFERALLPLTHPGPGEVVVQVAGCGVCHTDLGYYEGLVAPVAGFPLVLGHEISGRVVQVGEGAGDWEGKAVVVPAVIPCGTCPSCKGGRATSCPKGWMPGNHGDGGFASHITVPSRGLCAVPEHGLEGLDLADLSVVADAVTTPFQAIRRAGLNDGEVAVVVGAGGVGGFCVQIASALGAHVFALDVNPDRLAAISGHGASLVVNVRERAAKEVRSELAAAAREAGVPSAGWRIFECSGSTAGQELAFGLLNRGGSLSVVGFTPKAVSLRLSNLMAFDAEAYGNWGCDPALYPEALDLVLGGKIRLGPFLERLPMSRIGEAFDRVHHGRIPGRLVLIPD